MPASYNAIVFHGWTYLSEVEENPYLKLEGMSAEEYDLNKLSEVLRKLFPYATGEIILLGNGSDFARPQSSAPNLIKEWNKRHPDKKIRFSLPGEVFQAWEKQGKNIPTISADLNPLFQGTYCTRIDLKQQNRFLENYIEIAEKISACVPGADKDRIYRIEEAAEIMLYNQFHDIICGTLIDEAYQDSLSKYERARRLVNEVANSSLDEFMDVDLEVNKGLNLLVFNSIAKKREDVVLAKLSFSQDEVKGLTVIDKEGRDIPVQILEDKSVLRNGTPQNTEFSFILPAEAPPLGYNCYRIELSAQVIEIHTIKPIDENLITKSLAKTGAAVTVEEHTRFGGLFSAVSEVLGEMSPVPIEHVAIEDRFGESGTYEEVLKSCGLTVENIVKKAKLAVGRKR